MAVAIEWLEDVGELDGLAGEWDSLLPSGRPPFLHHAWFVCWWRAFGRGSLAVVVARRAGRLVGVLPLLRSGDRLASLANRHSQVFEPLAADAEAMRALYEAALGAAGGAFEIEALAAGTSALAELERAAQSQRRLFFVEPLRTAPIVETDGDFTAYAAGLAVGFWKNYKSSLLVKDISDQGPQVSIERDQRHGTYKGCPQESIGRMPAIKYHFNF